VLNVSFRGVDSEALMLALRSLLAVSNGAACSSAHYAPSHVLAAMGLGADRIATAIRFSWGPDTPDIPFDRLVEAIRNLSGDENETTR
jgi:cysteine desulfurase